MIRTRLAFVAIALTATFASAGELQIDVPGNASPTVLACGETLSPSGAVSAPSGRCAEAGAALARELALVAKPIGVSRTNTVVQFRLQVPEGFRLPAERMIKLPGAIRPVKPVLRLSPETGPLAGKKLPLPPAAEDKKAEEQALVALKAAESGEIRCRPANKLFETAKRSYKDPRTGELVQLTPERQIPADWTKGAKKDCPPPDNPPPYKGNKKDGGCGAWSVARCNRILAKDSASRNAVVSRKELDCIGYHIGQTPDGGATAGGTKKYYKGCMAEFRRLVSKIKFPAVDTDMASVKAKIKAGCDVKVSYVASAGTPAEHTETVVGIEQVGGKDCLQTDSWGQVATVCGDGDTGIRITGSSVGYTTAAALWIQMICCP